MKKKIKKKIQKSSRRKIINVGIFGDQIIVQYYDNGFFHQLHTIIYIYKI